MPPSEQQCSHRIFAEVERDPSPPACYSPILSVLSFLLGMKFRTV